MFPTSVKELENLGWDYIDVIFFTGDAFVDHPSFGTACISRWLEAAGYRVAIVPQPNWRDDLRDFRKLGAPRLYFAVNAGAMDSMVNHYTAAKRLRHDDAYTPEGRAGQRPDRAVTVYTRILKKLWPDVPVVIGGVEASLRRLTHYDYWSDSLMPSILVDSGADWLCYGMGEKPMLELTRAIEAGRNRRQIEEIRQLAFYRSGRPHVQDGAGVAQAKGGANAAGGGGECSKDNSPGKAGASAPGTVLLHSYEECCKDKRAFAENFHEIEIYANMLEPPVLIEPVGGGYVQVNPTCPPSTTEEMDSFWDLPFTKLPHPRYKGKRIPAYDMIKDSIITHRGCFGGCNFCTIAAHQGKFIQSRSEESILKEVRKLAAMPGFKGNISDVGAPTANMYGMQGGDMSRCAKCRRKSCLYPAPCVNLDRSHRRLLELYSRIDSVKGVRHSYIGSGIRYDLFLDENGFIDGSCRKYLETVMLKHTSGRMKVAPEHTEDKVLGYMAKPSFRLFERLRREFDSVNRKAGTHVELVPYFISSHPGCTLEDMRRLSSHPALKGIWMDQVQDFMPIPMTTSSVMFYSGIDPRTMKTVFVERDPERKRLQKSQFFRKNKKDSRKY
ncbi:MAG: YgiQ family radical SAM protein [Bacteroidales bacterium]|nr:YgiQ family radical SAM protein [Bacteroidales bacterium]